MGRFWYGLMMMMADPKEENEHVPKLMVYCDGCMDFHSSDEIISENIESDFMGRDVLTFECKTDEKIHKGIVVSS